MTTLKRILPRLVFTMALGLFVFTLLYSSRRPIPVQAQTQPIYMPRVNGNATNPVMSNVTVRLVFNFKSGSDTSNLNITAFGSGTLWTADGVQIMSLQPGGIVLSSNLLVGGVITGNGRSLTNIPESNLAVTTNAWTSSVVDFSLGTQVCTNMTNNITITGISGFNATNLNFQEIDISPSSTWVLAVPADWYVSGFTNSTTVAITNGTWAKLRVEAIIGRSTNISIEPYL